MRTITMMLSGLLLTGLTTTASASGGKDDWTQRIPECGKNTKVVKLVDYDEGTNSDRGDAGGVPLKIITFKEKKKKGKKKGKKKKRIGRFNDFLHHCMF